MWEWLLALAAAVAAFLFGKSRSKPNPVTKEHVELAKKAEVESLKRVRSNIDNAIKTAEEEANAASELDAADYFNRRTR